MSQREHAKLPDGVTVRIVISSALYMYLTSGKPTISLADNYCIMEITNQSHRMVEAIFDVREVRKLKYPYVAVMHHDFQKFKTNLIMTESFWDTLCSIRPTRMYQILDKLNETK